jgi:hypothetical protein
LVSLALQAFLFFFLIQPRPLLNFQENRKLYDKLYVGDVYSKHLCYPLLYIRYQHIQLQLGHAQ